MKTIFTLLFSMAMFSTTFAQYDQRDQRDRNKENDVYASNDNRGYDRHDRNYGGYVFTPRERDMQINQINREYDYKIQSVKNNYYMRRYQKIRQMQFLELQRDREIQAVIIKFNDLRNQFNNKNRRLRWDK